MEPTPTRTLGMRLSCNFVNGYTISYRVQYTYTFTRVHARIPNGHPREEKRACRTSRRTSRRGSSCVSGSWQAERAAARRLPRAPDTLTSMHARILARKSACRGAFSLPRAGHARQSSPTCPHIQPIRALSSRGSSRGCPLGMRACTRVNVYGTR